MIRFALNIVVMVLGCALVWMLLPHTSLAEMIPLARGNSDPAPQLRALGGTTRPSKLWADDFAAFVSAHPGQWLVGHCGQPCLSESEAAARARTDAANTAWIVLMTRMPQRPADADWLHKRVVADISAGRLQVDSLAEQFQRPYGIVWTESVLIDVSPAKLDSLLDSYKAERVEFRAHQINVRRAVVVAIVGSWLSYLFLNAVTKGYFTMRLRLAAMLLTVVGVAILL